MQDSDTTYKLDDSIASPGQKVAWDDNQPGALSKTAYTCGTSNATALATHDAARIYEVLDSLFKEQGKNIPQKLISVLVKALLVHGAKQDDAARDAIEAALKKDNRSRFKEVTARYLGYGAVQLERVLTCTAQRGTVLGFGEIREDKTYEYCLPLPLGLSESQEWRRMIVTLAWFSPVNPDHRNFRKARLEMQPAGNWSESPLKLARQDGDHHQVKRGTVQHEVLEGKKQIEAFQDGESILLHITCKKDATEYLGESIPYGLAVTLEVAQDTLIPIYEQLRTRLQPQVAVDAI